MQWNFVFVELLLDLVGLIACRYIVFLYIILMFFFFVEPKNYIRFLDKSIIKMSFTIKFNFPYAILKKLKL